MTTLAAAKKGKQVCLASDSLTIFGSRKEESSTHVHEAPKWIEVGPNVIGMSGHPSWGLILTHYFSKKKRASAPWKTPDQIFDLFHALQKELKEQYYLSPPRLKFLPFESVELQLLIVNAFGIFEVEYSKMVRQYNHYAAIGTGEEYALGAMSAVYERMTDATTIAKAGVEAAAQFDRKTGLPLHTYCIDLEE